MRNLSRVLLGLVLLGLFFSCKSKEEKLIDNYLSTIVHENGSTTKIDFGKIKFQSVENIPIDGKFYTSIVIKEPADQNRDSLKLMLKNNYNRANFELLESVFHERIAEKYSGYSRYEEEDKADESLKKAKNSMLTAELFGKLYRNYDNVSFHVLKAVYDTEIGEFKTKGITKYFIYDEENNKIIDSFSSFEEDVFLYYFLEHTKGINFARQFKKHYKLKDIEGMNLDEILVLMKKRNIYIEGFDYGNMGVK